jgi:hypothetical protein
MKKDIRDYVKVYKNIIPEDLCNRAVEELNTVEFIPHTFYDPKTNKQFTDDKELDSYYNGISCSNEFMQCTWNILNNYVIRDIAFPWNPGWNGFTTPKFNKYKPNTHMKEHCDHIHSIFTGECKGIPILSVIGALNNDYTGGEFIMFTDELYKLEMGDAIVFPSIFLYPHRVEPVTSGVRYSYVSWTW